MSVSADTIARPSVGKADVGLARGEQAADEQPRRHEQHDRHRDLGDDEHIARGPAAPADPCPGRVSLQIPDQVGASRAQCRREAGQDAGEQRNAGGKGEDARIQPEIERQRDRDRQVEGAKQLRQPRGQYQADAGAEDAEDDAFGQELTDETAATSTDGEADGDLSLTRGRAREQHPCDVRAGDHQHQCHREHRPGHDPREHAVRFGVKPRVGRRPDGDAPVLVRLGMLGAQSRSDHVENGPCLFDRRAGRQPRLDEKPALTATVEPRRPGG